MLPNVYDTAERQLNRTGLPFNKADLIAIILALDPQNSHRLYQLQTLPITDLNFIRRFLDKDYIKNTIIYTGLTHLSDITYILIKYFNFKLTNIFYNEFNINYSTENFEYINKLQYKLFNVDEKQQIIQCSNLFNFPHNFS